MSDAFLVMSRELDQLRKQVDNLVRTNQHFYIHSGKSKVTEIVGGSITATLPHIIISSEGGVPGDELHTIEGGLDGKMVVISLEDPADSVLVKDESISGGNIDLHGTTWVLDHINASVVLYYSEQTSNWHLFGIPQLEALRNMNIEGATDGFLLYKQVDGEWGALDPASLSGGAPSAHASTHQDGGSDEVATATPTPDAIPKADASGTLDAWITVGIGPRGYPGGDSLEYVFVDPILDSDPGLSALRFNNATFASVTELYIDDVDLAANDSQVWLSALGDSTNPIKGSLRIFKRDLNLNFALFNVTGVTEMVGYWKIAVTPVLTDSTYTLVDGDVVVVTWARAGDTGISGVGTTYTHTQSAPSTLWDIVHGLGKFPSATVVDSAGSVVYGDINYIDNTHLTVSFSAGFSGLAYLN